MTQLVGTKELLTLPAHTIPVQSLAFGQNELMATGDIDRIVRVWRGDQLRQEIDLKSGLDKIRPTERIRGLVFSNDSSLLYTACGDLIRTFSVLDGSEVWRYRPPRLWGFLIVSPLSISRSEAGEIAVATDAGRISVWTPDGALRSHWGDNDGPRQIAFLDNETLVGTDSFSICTWKSTTGRKLNKRKLERRTYGMSASPNAVALRSLHHVEVLDSNTLERKIDLPSERGLPLINFNPSGKLLAVGGLDKVLVYQMDGTIACECRLSRGWVRSLGFGPDGSTLFVGGSDGALRSWALNG